MRRPHLHPHPPPPPALTVAFDPASYSTTEGGDPVTVSVTLNRASNQDLTIPITVMPQGATEANDYTVSGLTDGTLSFALGDLSKTFRIVANEDTDSDDETIELSFGTLPEGVSQGETTTATLTITDDDVPPDTIELRVSPASVAENAGETDIMVTAAFPQGSATLSTPTVVNVTLAAATAQAADFTPVQPFNVTIPANARSGTATIQFTPNDDTSMEGSETVTVSGTTTASGITTINPATLTIIDDETPTTGVTLLVNPTAVSEGAGETTVTLTAALNGAARSESTVVTVAVGQTGDSATEGTDYETVNDLTVTIPGESTSTTETFTLTPIDDEITEGDETISVTGTTSAPGLTVTPTALRITDNETSPPPPPPPPPPALTVAFDPASYSTTEGGDPVTVSVTLNRASNQDLTIPITVMPQGATEANDYTVSGLTDGTLSFALGDLSKTFRIVANEDTDSDDETIELSFGTLPEGVSQGETTTATLTITDDDVPPDTIELRVSPAASPRTPERQTSW